MGILLVYDITRGLTYENAINRWLQEVKTYAESDAKVMLIGNKSDLRHLRAVATAEGKDFAVRNDMMFLETSALDATNVEEAHEILIKEIAEEVMKKELNSSGTRRSIGRSDTVDLTNRAGTTEEKKCCINL